MLAALVVLAGLAGGLLIWAPWQSPPLLRPAGLTAGPSTASSVAFHWSGPATGPLPDKYVILSGGRVIGSVPGRETSYLRTGLAPATAYAYRVAAVRGGSRSAPSAVLVVRTLTPPLSAARWQGPWTMHVRITAGGAALTGPRPLRWDDSLRVSPQCAVGPCPVRVAGTFNGYPFRAALSRAGAVYQGTTVARSFRCGPRHGAVPMRTTLKIRATITAAEAGSNGAWLASSWAGRLTASAAYTTTATFYCNAFQVTAALSGHS